jgi:c(7)-type cytochrome triheme protein
MKKYGNEKFAKLTAQRRREFVVFVFACFAFGYIFSSCSKPENKTEIIPVETPNSNTTEISVAPSVDPNLDFSKFDHQSAEHARFPCALCHERKDNSATPKLPGHLPCSSCHTVQFADNKNAICTICHKDAESGVVKAFPALKSHNVVFDHAKHLRQTNCATCHKPTRNGVAFSIPAGFKAHNSCFQCHSPDAKSGDKEIGSCNTCHQTGRFGGSISTQAKAFTATPFSHASHNLNCTACHNVKAGASRGNQLTAPLAAMHFAPKNVQSCASCHNNKRAFGGDDTADCARCHRGETYKF